MHIVTTRISEAVDNKLEVLAKETDRNKSYLIRKAIESYIQEIDDIKDAINILDSNEETISLEDIQKKHGLAH